MLALPKSRQATPACIGRFRGESEWDEVGCSGFQKPQRMRRKNVSRFANSRIEDNDTKKRNKKASKAQYKNQEDKELEMGWLVRKWRSKNRVSE